MAITLDLGSFFKNAVKDITFRKSSWKWPEEFGFWAENSQDLFDLFKKHQIWEIHKKRLAEKHSVRILMEVAQGSLEYF